MVEPSGHVPSPASHVCFVQFAFTSLKIPSLMFPAVSPECLGKLSARGWRVMIQSGFVTLSVGALHEVL